MKTAAWRVILSLTPTLMDDAPLMAAPDRDLLRRYREGDVEAFMQLYRRYSHALHLYALALVRDAALAQDLLQESFVRLLAADPSARLDSAQPFLFTVLRHLAIDHARRAAVRRHAAPTIAREARPADPLQRSIVAEALLHLPEEQREVVVMKVWGGMTLAEVAQLTGVPAATATSRYRYGIERLEELLGEGP